MDSYLRELERLYKQDPSSNNQKLLQMCRVRLGILPEVCHTKICTNRPDGGKFHENGFCWPCWVAVTGKEHGLHSAVCRMYRVDKFEVGKWYIIPKVPSNQTLLELYWHDDAFSNRSALNIPLCCDNVWGNSEYADLRTIETLAAPQTANSYESDPYAFSDYAAHVSWVIPYYGEIK